MYDMSLDQFAVNSFDWQKLYTPYWFFSSYDMRENLAQKYYQKRMEYYNEKYVDVPQFNWFDSYSILNSIQGEAAGISVYNTVVPSPVRAPKVAGSPKMKLQSLRIDDEAVEILNSGRQLTEEEIKQFTDVKMRGLDQMVYQLMMIILMSL